MNEGDKSSKSEQTYKCAVWVEHGAGTDSALSGCQGGCTETCTKKKSGAIGYCFYNTTKGSGQLEYMVSCMPIFSADVYE